MARLTIVSRRIHSGVLAIVAVSLTLVVGLLVTVVATPASTTSAVSGAAILATTGDTPPTLGLRLAAQSFAARSVSARPSAARSQDEAPAPTTSARVLPSRCLEGDEALPARPGPCVITSYGRDRPTVIIWGDSHAWQQIPALRAQAKRTRTNLVAFVMGACPPMDLRDKGYRGLCIEQSERALAYIATMIERERRLKVVLGGFWELYRDYAARGRAGWAPDDAHDRFLLTRAQLFAAGGGRLFRTLGRWDVPTAAIAQAPWVSDAAPDCAAGEQPYSCDLARSAAIPDEAATSQWLKSQLARIRLSGYIDTARFLCGADVCRAALRGQPVYLDNLHLDPTITGSFAPEYRDLFR